MRPPIPPPRLSLELLGTRGTLLGSQLFRRVKQGSEYAAREGEHLAQRHDRIEVVQLPSREGCGEVHPTLPRTAGHPTGGFGQRKRRKLDHGDPGAVAPDAQGHQESEGFPGRFHPEEPVDRLGRTIRLGVGPEEVPGELQVTGVGGQGAIPPNRRPGVGFRGGSVEVSVGVTDCGRSRGGRSACARDRSPRGVRAEKKQDFPRPVKVPGVEEEGGKTLDRVSAPLFALDLAERAPDFTELEEGPGVGAIRPA